MIKLLLLLTFLAYIWMQSEGKVIVERDKLENDIFVITCEENGTLEDIDMPRFEGNVFKIATEGCPPPKTGSYARTLRKLGVNIRGLRWLYIANVPTNTILRNEHFEDLTASVEISRGHSILHINQHSALNNETGAVNLTYGGTVDIFCNRKPLEDQLSPLFDHTLYLNNLIITECPLPQKSYAEVLAAMRIGTTVKNLKIVNTTEEPLKEVHFVGLEVENINISRKKQNNDEITNYKIVVNFTENMNLSTGNQLDINCYATEDKMINIPRVLPDQNVRVKEVEINKCSAPRVSYAEDLQRLGVDHSSIKELQLFDVTADAPLHVELFKGLNLDYLVLHALDVRSVLKPDTEEFEPLVNLTKMYLRHVMLPPLPERMQLQKAILWHGMSVDLIGGCSKIQEMVLIQWDVPPLLEIQGYGWLKNCSSLERLELQKLSVHSVRRALLGAKSIKTLLIDDCNLSILSGELLSDAKLLTELTLIKSKINDIERDSFVSATELTYLDLSHNLLDEWWKLRDILHNLSKLKTLILAHNNMQRFCDGPITSDLLKRNHDDGKPLPNANLEEFSLHGTNLSRLCFENWVTLKNLDLSDCHITELKFNRLPSPQKHSVIIDLRRNPLSKFPGSVEDYNIIKSKFEQAANTTVQVDLSLDCDCQHAWFARVLRDTPQLKVEGADCISGAELRNVPSALLECDKTHCASGCVCRTSWNTNATDVDCHGAELRHVPRVNNLRTLQAPGNFIENIDAADLPDSLLELDLRDNHLSRVNAETAVAFFRVKERRIKFAANPFACDCKNKPLIYELQAHSDQVEDYDNVTCVGSGLPIKEVEVDALCKADNERMVLVTALVSGAFVFLVLIMFVLYRRYDQSIKMFLYTRGYCLSCLHEEEIDSDRPYDAFLSFSHKDEEFVLKNLLPGLEKTPQPYKICVHFRDWIAGELIPSQIARSVSLSRRVIIVLSKNFLESVWGMLEFRMAYMNSMQEGRSRIILVVLDDVVNDEKLDTDLKDYVTSRTYVRWGDQWFWEKIQYAMPHRSNNASTVPLYEATSHSSLGTSIGSISPTGSRLELEHWPIPMSMH